MCRTRALIRIDEGEAVEHVCQLPKTHFLPHRCWCGWGFIRSYTGRALPAAFNSGYPDWVDLPEST